MSAGVRRNSDTARWSRSSQRPVVRSMPPAKASTSSMQTIFWWWAPRSGWRASKRRWMRGWSAQPLREKVAGALLE
ncbi:MAG: hypothetical protein BGN94_16135 [Rhizobiales bacterium 68-8]|nr:MAG: hypothetical protein BGN94_16135 [Rhizobiales bacterium 68-8]